MIPEGTILKYVLKNASYPEPLYIVAAYGMWFRIVDEDKEYHLISPIETNFPDWQITIDKAGSYNPEIEVRHQKNLRRLALDDCEYILAIDNGKFYFVESF